MRFALFGALLILPAAAQAAHEPLRLAPRTDWVMDYAEERCSLHRGFGEGETSLNLRIDWFGPRAAYRVLLVGPAIPQYDIPFADLRHRLTPDNEDRQGSALNGTFLDLPAVSFSTNFVPLEPDVDYARMSEAERMERGATPRPPQPEFEAQVNSLELRFTKGPIVVVDLGNMAKPLEAMRTCMDNLQTSWGLDPVQQAALARLAVPKPSTVRRVQARYPRSMVASGTNAFVPVRVMVDARGRATSCVVQSEGIEEAFRDAVCDGLARGYEPARDPQGKAVPSVYATAVVYQLN